LPFNRKCHFWFLVG